MPTGHTRKLYEGEQTLAEFAWGCARSRLYDWAEDRPIPERFEPEGYTLQSLEEAKANLAAAEAMTVEEAADAMRAERAKVERFDREHFEVARVRFERFEAMAKRVRDWAPKTREQAELNGLMLDELRTEFRGGAPEKRDLGPLPDPAEWLRRKREEARHTVDHHEAVLARARESAERQTAFFAALRAEFGEDPATERARKAGK